MTESSLWKVFLASLQKECLPAFWSRGISLSKSSLFQEVSSNNQEEFRIRIQTPTHIKAWEVKLWPQEEDAYCSCDKELCEHIVAAALYLSEKNKSPTSSSVNTEGVAVLNQLAKEGLPLIYGVRRTGESQLLLERRWNGKPIGSLRSHMGALSSGRISGGKPLLTDDDWRIDEILFQIQNRSLRKSDESWPLEHQEWVLLWPYLPRLEDFDQSGDEAAYQLELERSLLKPRIKISLQSGAGNIQMFRIERKLRSEIIERFENGPVIMTTLIKDHHQKKIGLVRPFSSEDIELKVRHSLDRDSWQPISTVWLEHEYPLLERECEIVDTDIRQLHKKEFLNSLVCHFQWVPSYQRSYPEDLLVQVVFCEPFLKKKLMSWGTSAVENSSGETLRILGPRVPEFILWFKSVQGEDPQGQLAKLQLNESVAERPAWESVDQGFRWQWNPEKQSYEALPSWLVDLLAQGVKDQENPSMRFKESEGSLSQNRSVVGWKILLREFLESDEKNKPTLHAHPGFKGVLRHYQEMGVQWILDRFRRVGSCLLADDMGLGKTWQALAALQTHDLPSLILCPTSVLFQWSQEIQKALPEEKLCIYSGSKRQLDPRATLILTSHALVRQDKNLFLNQEFATCVLDESHAIKNPQSQLAQVCREIRAQYKLALTGTPLENRVSDFESQMDFLFHHRGIPALSFDSSWAPRFVPQLVLRRKKSEVLKELPEKTILIYNIDWNDEEKQKYLEILNSVRSDFLKMKNSGETRIVTYLEKILRLRQAACDLRLLNPDLQVPSQKTEWLMSKVSEVLACGHKALVFSQWTRSLDFLEKDFLSLQIPLFRIDGSTLHRDQVIQKFQDLSTPGLLLCSLKAAGIGLNLTMADHAFFYEPWWNPAVEAQAQDRIHRIGQTQSVVIHRLIRQDSLEEVMEQIQVQKRQLGEDLFSNPQLSLDDLFSWVGLK